MERQRTSDIREILEVTGGTTVEVTGGTTVEETDRSAVTLKSWKNYLEGKEGVAFQNWRLVTDGGEKTKMMMGRAGPCREVHRSRP